MTGYIDSGANYYARPTGQGWTLLKQPTDEWTYDVYGDARESCGWAAPLALRPQP